MQSTVGSRLVARGMEGQVLSGGETCDTGRGQILHSLECHGVWKSKHSWGPLK